MQRVRGGMAVVARKEDCAQRSVGRWFITDHFSQASKHKLGGSRSEKRRRGRVVVLRKRRQRRGRSAEQVAGCTARYRNPVLGSTLVDGVQVDDKEQKSVDLRVDGTGRRKA
jgi:hypothetical protein